MKVRQDSSGTWLVRLERGEVFRSTIENFASEIKLPGARVSAIGMIENPELALYDVGTKRYVRQRYTGVWELISAYGNISLTDGKPVIYMRGAIAGYNELEGRDFEAFGGRLVDFHVAVNFEMFIVPMHDPLHKPMHPDIGLPMWEL